jgi:predicted ArsR family transcriptional regulator
VADAPRLDVLKALGDNTRYAIYLEIARSSVPLTTTNVADALDLHPNTVRPHLERMRDVGLLVVETESRGVVGRPQHRYSLSPDAPTLGFEPPAMPIMSRMLLGVATAAGASRDEAVEIGRAQGRAAAAAIEAAGVVADLDDPEDRAAVCIAALVDELARVGFDPAVAEDGTDGGVVIGFTRCPFAELAEANPQLVCNLHRGLIEGFVDAVGGATVTQFGTLVDRAPCQVALHGR